MSATPLFDPVEIEFARDRVRDSEMPISPDAASLISLNAPEPFLTYVFAASEALRVLDAGGTSAEVVQTGAEIVERIATWVGGTLPTADGGALSLACKKGCNLCCSLRVNAVAPEVEVIERFITERFSPEDILSTNAAVERFVSEASKLDEETRAIKPMLCPLNRNGECTVYDVRPMTCRNHHSFSFMQCQLSYDRWTEDLPVTRSTMRKLCGDVVIEAMIDVLRFRDQDARVLDLPEALHSQLS